METETKYMALSEIEELAKGRWTASDVADIVFGISPFPCREIQYNNGMRREYLVTEDSLKTLLPD